MRRCKCGDAYCVALSHISAKFLNRQQFSIVSVESASEYCVNVRRQLANTIYVHNIGCELWHEMPANFRYLRFCLMHMYICLRLYIVHCILYTHTQTPPECWSSEKPIHKCGTVSPCFTWNYVLTFAHLRSIFVVFANWGNFLCCLSG